MEKIPYFDAHCDTLCRCRYQNQHLRGDTCKVSLDHAGTFSQFAQFFAIFYNTDQPRPHSCLEETSQIHALYLRELDACSDLAVHCDGRAAVEATNAAGKAAAMLSIEDSALLECDPAQLELAAGWGVQAIGLTWNHRNLVSGSCWEDPEQGLTDRGRAFVQEAQRLRILMDVSHLSPKGFWDLAEMTEQPIVATHSNAMALCPHARNLTDDQFRAIAQSGGVAGLNVYQDFLGGEGGIPTMIAHLEHFLDLGGEDAVGLGTDFDGCDPVCRGLDNIQSMPRLWEALKDRGYGDGLLRKLFWGNWLRVIRP